MKIQCECYYQFEFLFARRLPMRIEHACPNCGKGWLIRVQRYQNADDLDTISNHLVKNIVAKTNLKIEV